MGGFLVKYRVRVTQHLDIEAEDQYEAYEKAAAGFGTVQFSTVNPESAEPLSDISHIATQAAVRDKKDRLEKLLDRWRSQRS